MSSFEFKSTLLNGLTLVQRKVNEDQRGFLSRFFCVDEFREAGFNMPISQINHTLTRNKGSMRGFHFQYPPYAETKLVSCLHGEVFDVAVDLRNGSSTFLQWYGTILTAQNRQSLLIPKGFAHGFQTLTDDCELVYLHTESYHPEAEGGLNAADPMLRVEWPLEVTDISDRDRNHQLIKHDFKGLSL